MPQPLLQVEDLHKKFGDLEVLKGVNLSLTQGRKLSILGPSGSGKSTLLRCVNYLEEPSSGHIYLEGDLVGEKLVNSKHVRMSSKELAPQRAEIGMVFRIFICGRISPPGRTWPSPLSGCAAYPKKMPWSWPMSCSRRSTWPTNDRPTPSSYPGASNSGLPLHAHCLRSRN